MVETSRVKIGLLLVLLLVFVVALSLVSVKIRGGHEETVGAKQALVLEPNQTVAEFGRQNNLPNPVLKDVFGLASPGDLEKSVASFNLAEEEIKARVNKRTAIEEESASKNWILIPLKFALWIIFLSLVFVMVRRKRVTSGRRKWLYFSALTIFGVVLGADPAAMGTVKDAIVLYGQRGVIFPPRLVAMTVFLLMVFLANKFICSWGCQLGTLQDLIFRFNRNNRDTKGVMRQYKPPFVLTNTVRVLFFMAFTMAALVWATDIIAPVDPFRIYKPAMLGLWGGLFLAAILVASLFVYRPWCLFFCPFGLVGWLVEKISLFKIKVNYETCVACEACARACPSTVMGAILKREKKVIPDCFACATCIEVCPTDSISLGFGTRTRPPAGKFDPARKGATGGQGEEGASH